MLFNVLLFSVNYIIFNFFYFLIRIVKKVHGVCTSSKIYNN